MNPNTLAVRILPILLTVLGAAACKGEVLSRVAKRSAEGVCKAPHKPSPPIA